MIDMVTDYLNGPDVWLGRDLQRADDWIIRLDDSDIAEIDAALAVAKARGLEIPFGTIDFPLNRLRIRSAHLRDMVCRGYGVALLRASP